MSDKYADEGMRNYFLCVLIRRTPVFRTYIHKSIVSKHVMDVTRGSRWVGNQDECIRVNGIFAHPLCEISNAQGQPPFVFSYLRFQCTKCRLQIRILELKMSDFGVVVGFVCVLGPTRKVCKSNWRFEIDWFAFTSAPFWVSRAVCRLELLF